MDDNKQTPTMDDLGDIIVGIAWAMFASAVVVTLAWIAASAMIGVWIH